MGGWLAGWVGGSNGNKANLSPAEAGAGLSLAKIMRRTTTSEREQVFASNSKFQIKRFG